MLSLSVFQRSARSISYISETVLCMKGLEAIGREREKYIASFWASCFLKANAFQLLPFFQTALGVMYANKTVFFSSVVPYILPSTACYSSKKLNCIFKAPVNYIVKYYFYLFIFFSWLDAWHLKNNLLGFSWLDEIINNFFIKCFLEKEESAVAFGWHLTLNKILFMVSKGYVSFHHGGYRTSEGTIRGIKWGIWWQSWLWNGQTTQGEYLFSFSFAWETLLSS